MLGIRKYVHFLVLSTVVASSAGCYRSEKAPLWSPMSGEELPFAPGEYVCTDDKGTPTIATVTKQSRSNDLYYVLELKPNSGAISFHRIIGNTYLMAMEDLNDTYSYLYIHLKDGVVQALDPNYETVGRLAKEYDMLDEQGSVDIDRSTPHMAKKFLTELGKNLTNADVVERCSLRKQQ